MPIGLKQIFSKPAPTQLELEINRQFELDRNYALGGRSFYFFDFDDNIAILTTSIYIFHKDNGTELALSSREFAEVNHSVGRSGIYKDYEIRFDDETGSFRDFRDRDHKVIQRWFGKKQAFVEDLLQVLGLPEYNWKGPSWNCFYHAVYNRRPTSVITARGHAPETIKAGFRMLIKAGHLPHEPNLLSLYPVNHPTVRQMLDADGGRTVAELKQRAIRASVEQAFKTYGYNKHHRFGMSDDDPKNLDLIIDEMSRLKQDYPEISFFVFDTQKGQLLKREIFADHIESQSLAQSQQISLF